jgi:hypothetical protein
MNERDMNEWLNWHLNRCHFDNIHIIDNDSAFNLKSICEQYSGKVSYEAIHGFPRQYAIYYDYVNNRSTAEWIMPIDDDEYLELSNEFSSVEEAISYYQNIMPDMEMLSVRWKHLFPVKFKSERTGAVLDYCTREHLTLACSFHRFGDRGVKTIVHRTGKVHYQEGSEIVNRGHIPLHEKAAFSYGFDGRKMIENSFGMIPQNTENEKIRLIHCRYKGYSEYLNKYIRNECVKISDKAPHPKQFLFNLLLPQLD